MSSPRQALIGAGANLGDRLATLSAAIDALRRIPQIVRVACSRVYETDPVGPVDQPAFLNLVAGVETTLSPEALLEAMQAIETRFGRVRTVRWGPRTLDLDLLAYEGESRHTARLMLPHPRMRERAFVLVPLADVLAHPGFQRAAWDDLRASLPRPPPAAGVRVFAPALQGEILEG